MKIMISPKDQKEFKEISEDMVGVEEYKGSCAVVGDQLIRPGGYKIYLKNIIHKLTDRLNMFKNKD